MEHLARDLDLEAKAEAIILRIRFGKIERRRARKADSVTVSRDGRVVAKVGNHRYAIEHVASYKNHEGDVMLALRFSDALNVLGEFTPEEYEIVRAYQEARERQTDALYDKHKLESFARKYNIDLPAQLAFRELQARGDD